MPTAITTDSVGQIREFGLQCGKSQKTRHPLAPRPPFTRLATAAASNGPQTGVIFFYLAFVGIVSCPTG